MAKYSVLSMLNMAHNAGYRGMAALKIVAIAMAESGGNSDANNGTHFGILQFSQSTASENGLTNPFNAQDSFNTAFKMTGNDPNSPVFATQWTNYESTSRNWQFYLDSVLAVIAPMSQYADIVNAAKTLPSYLGPTGPTLFGTAGSLFGTPNQAANAVNKTLSGIPQAISNFGQLVVIGGAGIALVIVGLMLVGGQHVQTPMVHFVGGKGSRKYDEQLDKDQENGND